MVKAGKSLSAVVLALVVSLVAVAMASTVEADRGELHVGPGQTYATIQAAIDAASDGDTIIVHEGTYDGFTVEDKNDLSIIGQAGVTVNSANPLLPPPPPKAMSSIDGGEYWAMAVIARSTGIDIEGIDFDGEEIEENVVEGICYVNSTGSITDVTMRNIVGTDGEGSMGMGIFVGGGEIGTVEILGVTAENVTNGIMVSNDEASVRECTIDGEAVTDLGVGIFAMNNARVTIEDSRIINWRGTGYMDGQEAQSIGIGIGLQRWYGPMATSTAEIRGCTIENNIGGISVDSDGRATINYNNIVGNQFGIFNVGEIPVDATNNWWGDASGPSGVGPGTGDAISDNVDYSPWLKAELTPVVTGLVSIDDKLEVVYGFHDGTWTWYNPSWPPAANTLTTLYKGRGYWIRVSEGCDLTHGDNAYPLDEGWNLIGWLGW